MATRYSSRVNVRVATSRARPVVIGHGPAVRVTGDVPRLARGCAPDPSPTHAGARVRMCAGLSLRAYVRWHAGGSERVWSDWRARWTAPALGSTMRAARACVHAPSLPSSGVHA